MAKLPYIVSRDNTGLVLIDVKNYVAYLFAQAPISVNLFGHGDILRVINAEVNVPGGGKARLIQLWTIMEYSEHAEQAALVCV